MRVDRSHEARLAELHGLRAKVRELEAREPSLKGGGGGGTLDGMEARVTKLETHMEYVRRDLGEIKTDLKTAITRLNELPTKAEVGQWKLVWTGLVVAAIALIVGGIIGGLSWLEPDPIPTQPVEVLVTPPTL